MLEMILSPRKAERHPWEMLFIGLVYGSLSILLVQWVFASDPVLSKYSGILVVTFTVMFSLPFMFYLIKNEEQRDFEEEGSMRILKEHGNAMMALLWLFLGFVLAFSFWYIVLGSDNLFKAQIETYCQINSPQNLKDCIGQYQHSPQEGITAAVASTKRVLQVFTNNIYVLIFTLLFSLIFGAGAIFILAWNASVIAAAIDVFAKSDISNMPIAILRYMIHGIPEIAAYFIGAMAGGIVSIAIIRHHTRSEKFWNVLQDSLNLIVIAIIILVLAAFVEVYITPSFFN